MKDKIILNKIVNYIKELYGFIDGYTYEQFQGDKKTINACVFNLSQIGELVAKLSNSIIESNPEIEWRGLKSLRNGIVHDYDGVNLTMIWGFLTTELNQLELQIAEVLSKESNGD